MTKLPTEHHGRPFKELKRAYLDFEYNGTREERFNLVSCALKIGDTNETDIYNYWLHHDPAEQKKLKNMLISLRETHMLVAFNVVAEASSLISLGLHPAKFCWMDLQLEWKMLINHCHKYMYGKQLIDGRTRNTKPPGNKWEMTEEQKKAADNSKPNKSLAAACYKMLGHKVDTQEKDEVRDLIISSPPSFTDEQRDRILAYGETDVDVLPPLRQSIVEAYRNSEPGRRGDITLADICWRAGSAARTAMMMQTGYPVKKKAVKNFAASTSHILQDIAEDVNEQFPDLGLFVWNKGEGRYTMKQKPQKDFIADCPYVERWDLTETGNYSLSLEAWAKHYSFRHDFPRNNLPAQILRYLKTKQSLNGFMPTNKRRKNFFDSYGDDGRARAWLNPYGSQSSRFQPAATGFIPLKAAWMRSLIQPRPGRCIIGIDYSSEEFLIGGVLSRDLNMIESYASGDPYTSFAKLAGAIPPDGDRNTHPLVRIKFKSTCLARGSLIRVRGCGYLPIEKITPEHEVWDGDTWRKSRGAKLMGNKEVLEVEGVRTTLDHKVWTERGWREVGAAKKTRGARGLHFEDAKRLRRPSASWSEVWAVASSLTKDALSLLKKRET